MLQAQKLLVAFPLDTKMKDGSELMRGRWPVMKHHLLSLRSVLAVSKEAS